MSRIAILCIPLSYAGFVKYLVHISSVTADEYQDLASGLGSYAFTIREDVQ